MANVPSLFVALLLMQVFFAFATTIFFPQIPAMAYGTWYSFVTPGSVIDLATLSSSVQGSVSSQTTIPVLSIGSLIFYSSTIVINLLANFITAVPQMAMILIKAIFFFIPMSVTISSQVSQTFIIMITIFYYLLLLFYIAGSRSTNSSALMG